MRTYIPDMTSAVLSIGSGPGEHWAVSRSMMHSAATGLVGDHRVAVVVSARQRTLLSPVGALVVELSFSQATGRYPRQMSSS